MSHLKSGNRNWPPQTFPRPSSNPRPAGLVVRLRGGIAKRGNGSTAETQRRGGAFGEMGNWWRVAGNALRVTRNPILIAARIRELPQPQHAGAGRPQPGGFTAETQRRGGAFGEMGDGRSEIGTFPSSICQLPSTKSILSFARGAALALTLALTGAAQAQVTITPGATVTQNFSSLGTNGTATLPSGWRASKSSTAREVTAYSTAVTAVERAGGTNLSSSAVNGIYNFGSSDTDRAVGGLSSSSASKSVNLYVALQNTGGSSIPSFSISYKAERYRNGSNSAGFSIQMYYSTDGTTWTSAGSNFLSSFAANADNNGAATVPIETKSVTSQVLANSLAAGSTLYLAWNYAVTSGTTTSNAQALGVSDIEIVAAGGGGGTPPAITGISPASGLAGTIVTITGTDFTGATAVRFNGMAAASFTVDSATSITATAPTGVTTGPISVTTAGGTASSTGNFTVPALSIAVSGGNSINEGDSSRTATITATPAPTSDLTVTLTSSSAADLTVDGGSGAGATATATISANTTEASFFLNAPADNTVDADASVTLTATASGYNGGTAAVTVRNVDFNPPAIVINKIYNSGVTTPSGADDVVELLVVGNGTPGSTVDLQGMILKDYSSSAANDGGGAYIFANNALWSAVKAGTLIVLTKPGTTPPAEDVDGADFVIRVNLSNTTYFTAGTGTFDVGGTELVQIKASGSAQTGSTGAIHSFAVGTSSAAQVVAAPAPKLICAASGNNPFAKNSTKALVDFNGTDAAQSASALPLGIANNADNSTYISSLRGSKDISISVDSAVAIINENAGLQAGKITVALSQPTTEDVTVNLSASPLGVVTIPSTAVILNGASSASIDVTPINDNAITGNRVVTITGSATGWSSGNNTMTIVDVQFNSPSVVINELVNGGTGGADVVELLVVENNLNMVGMILKDFSTNMTGDAGRQFTFADNALWQSVKAGTLLVLTSDAATTEDTDASDGVVTIKLTNTTYFAATGGTFDISNTDMVMIKASGSGTTGITGAIHTFGNGAAGSLFNLANGAKLLFAAGSAGGGADNATSAIGDYNGTGVTGGTATLGSANNASNLTYITALRGSSGPTAPSNLSYSPSTVSGTVGTAISSLTPTVTGTVDTYSVSPTLPAGLLINASSGVISGTPTAVATSASYTVTASNAGGSTTAQVTIAVGKGTPTISVAPTASAITAGQALSASLLTGGSASVPGTFAWTDGTTLPSSTGSYGVTFTPTDTANYNTATTTASVTVNSATPSGSSFSGWLGTNSPSSALILQYAYGAASASTTVNRSNLPSAVLSNSSLVMTYYVRKEATNPNLVTPQVHTNLSDASGWGALASSNIASVATNTVDGVEVVQKKATVPVEGTKKFLRLKIAE